MRGDRKDEQREHDEYLDRKLKEVEEERHDRSLDTMLERDKEVEKGRWIGVNEYKAGGRTSYETLKDPNFYEKFKPGNENDDFYVLWAKNLVVAIQTNMRSETQEQGYLLSWLERRFHYKTHNDVKYLNQIRDAKDTRDLLEITKEILNDTSSSNKSLRILVAAHLPIKHDFAIDKMLGIKSSEEIHKLEGKRFNGEIIKPEVVSIDRIKRIADMPSSKSFVNKTAQIVDAEISELKPRDRSQERKSSR